ncbi:MAG: DUF711 family protein [Bacteroidales bacterium]|nr:DUF711 family protein [Bacteroidales bacterium]
MENKVIRTICYFTDRHYDNAYKKLSNITETLVNSGYSVQTRRICTKDLDFKEIESTFDDKTLLFGAGTQSREALNNQIQDILDSGDVSFNLDLTKGVEKEDVEFLFKLIETKAEKTFNFSYKFFDSPSTPFFPVATFQQNGFSLGLQATDLSEHCKTIDEWLEKIKSVWDELCSIFEYETDFLGIDSSIAPLFEGKSSFIAFIKRLYGSFPETVTKDVYLRITKFIKEQNPRPLGLCGIMFPCLEDFELADEYKTGNFSIERNIFLSLHSGLGIDTYPIGIDESPERVYEILCVLQAFSEKYNKPLSARFVSDGKARIGDMTDFRNQYMKDVIIRPL